MHLIMWHNITWRADCTTQEQPLPSLFLWSWLCSFRGDCLPYISPVTSLTLNSGESHWLSVSGYVCGKTEGVGEQRAAQTGLHNRLHASASFGKISKQFQSCVPPHILVPWPLAALDLNSMKTLDDTPLTINPIFQELCKNTSVVSYLTAQHLCACSKLSHGSGKSAEKPTCPSGHWGSVKRDPVWMNEHGPADRGRSLCRESAEDYCSPQSRDGTEATEANMTPVICTWCLFYSRNC